MAKNRNILGNKIKDTGSISNEQYNEASGAAKSVEIGPKLIPIPTATGGTTSANAAAVGLPVAGRSVYIYNNSLTMGAVSFGGPTISAPVAGTIDASGAVGIPCEPNTWSRFSCGDATFVRTSAVTLLVFLVEDDSSLVQQKR